MLVHIHIPKNAGTSVHTMLILSFGSRYVPYYDYYTQNFRVRTEPIEESKFLDYVDNLPLDTIAIGGHHIRPPERSIRSDLKFFTFIRDPVERVISHYYYEREHCKMYPDLYPKNHCSQQDFHQYLAERPKDNLAISNGQTYALTGGVDPIKAIILLEQFIAVGIVEKFEESISILNYRMPANIGRLEPHIVPMNRTKSRLPKSDIDRKLIEQIIAMNAADMRLYEYALERHQANKHF